MAQDTRKDPRARVLQMTVRYKSATVDEFIEHHSHDVSRGGIFIKTPSPFPAGTLLKFEIRLQDEQAVIAGVGRVVWKREPAQASDAHPAGMGVKFIKIDEKSKAVITRLVDAQAGAGSAFEAGITDRTDLGDEVHEITAPAATASAPQPEPAPSKAAQAQVKRASTMLGLGSIGASSKGDAGKGEATKKADAAEGGSFFPQTNPEKEMPPPDERTMMKQAAELLKQALADAGGSLDEIGASKEPLMAAPPKKAEPAPAPKPKEEHARPLAEPAAIPVQAVAQLANEREARDEMPAAEARPAKAAAARRPAEVADKAPADDLHGKPARQDAKAADDHAKAKPAAAKPKEDKATAAKAATASPAPLAQEEESSGTGRLLTILLVAAALCGALWLVFGQSDPKPPANPPTAPEPPAVKPTAPTEKPQPTEAVPAATDKAAPAEPAAPAATIEAPAAPTTTAEPAAPKATAEPAAPTTTVEPAAPKATAEPAAPTTTAEPAAPTTTAEPAAPTTTAEPAAPKPAAEPAAPKPAPRPRPAAPKPPKNDDPYG
ncbi:TIGR02266 family protein [Sorangium sp. So ce1000]|uniref:TIGR02266 family protein n=1 Tax=Sorangium sp. So ce1000 TaxID=3133325 RepID=UPI003F5FB834